MPQAVTQILKSRTTWTIFFMFILGGVQNVTAFMPTSLATMVNAVLMAVAIYFHINPSQNYGAK